MTRVAILVASLFLAAFWYLYGIRLADGPFVDAKSFWLAARMAFVEGVSPYGPAFDAAAAETPGGHAHPFVYPPPALVLLSPLAATGYPAGGALLLAASHLAFVLLALALWRIAAPGDTRARAAVLAVSALIALSQASRITLGHGQVNFLVLAGLAWFIAALAGRGPGWAGAPGLVVATVLKPWFGAFAVFLLLPGGRRMILPAAVAAAALLAATALLAPPGLWGGWLEETVAGAASDGLYLGRFEIYGSDNHALRAALDIAGLPRAAFLPVAAVMAVLHALALWRGRGSAEGRVVMAAATLLLVHLLAPVSWVHYALYGAVACGLFALMGGRVLALAGWAGLVLLLQPSALQALHPALRFADTALFTALWALAVAVTLLAGRAPPRSRPPHGRDPA